MRKFLGMLSLVVLTSFLQSCGGGGGSSSTETTEEVRTSTTDVVGQISDTTYTATRTFVRATSTESSTATVKLIVDFNGDGKFEESGSVDKVYEAVTADGRFQFHNVEIPATGAKANLIVTKEGYATYSKVLELKPETPINVDALLAPASTQVVPITKTTKAAGKLFITLTKSGDIKVSSGVRAVSIEDSELTVAIDETALADSVTAIKASMKVFNSAKKEDIKYFPGEFKGTNPKGEGEVQLESLTFSLVDLKDQDGNPLSVVPTRADGCLYEVTQTLPPEAINKIKEKGDFNPDKLGCQVPIYSYNFNSEGWDYLGEGDVLDSSGTLVDDCSSLDPNQTYQVDICITEPNWGDYVNLDYPIYFDEVKTAKLCFSMQDADGNPISGTWFELYSEGLYADAVTDERGVAELEIPVANGNAELTCDSVKNYLATENVSVNYYNYSFSTMPIPLDLDTLTTSQLEGCTCTFNVRANISYLDVAVVVRDEKGNPVGGREVCLRDSNYYYYNCKYTDEEGTASFKVIAGKDYTAFGPKLTPVTKTVSETDRVFVLEAGNSKPVVNVYAFPNPVKAGEDLTVGIYAYDLDRDDITLKSVTCGNSQAKIEEEERFDGYLFATATCKFDGEGSYTVSAEVSDGIETSSDTTSVQVVSNNTPPFVYGYIFIDGEGNVVSPDSLKVNTTYNLIVYAYDPDGDELTYSVDNSSNCSVGEEGLISCTFTQTGPLSFTVTVSDANGASTQETVYATVVDVSIPPEIVYVGLDSLNVSPGGTFSLEAYVYDPDSDLLSWELYVNGDEQPISSGSCKLLEEGYFECTLEDYQVPQEFEPGSYQFTFVVKDGSSQTDTETLNVVVGELNASPQILKGLPETVQINMGESYTFEIDAVDPDGDPLTYTWYVNGEKVGEGNNTFTYTFSDSGSYVVKVEVSDGKSTVFSQTAVTVINPNATNRLVIHFGVEGIYVSILDSDMNIVRTLVTDESGTVDFGELGVDKVNISITVSPDVVMPEDVVFENFIGNLYDTCWNSSNSCDISYTDVLEWFYAGKVPLSVANQMLNVDLSNFDEDSDGYLSPDEIYAFLLTLRDKNGDGKIEASEVEDFYEIHTVVIKDVPVKEHVFGGISEMVGYEFGHYFGYDWGYGAKLVNVTVTDVPEGVYLHAGYEGCEVANGIATCSTYVPLLEDGTYALLISDYTNMKALVVKDVSTDNLQLSYDQFVPMKKITAVNFDESASWEFLSIKTYYKGGEFYIGWIESGWGENYVVEPDFGTDYFVHYKLDRYSETAGDVSYSWRIDNFNIGANLSDTIDVSEFMSRLLKVSIDVDPVTRTVALSGEELSLVDEIDIGEEFSGEAGYFYLEFDMPYGGETTVTIPDVTKVVPPEVYTNYVKPIVDSASWWELEADAMDIENFVWDSVEVDEGEERAAEARVYSELTTGTSTSTDSLTRTISNPKKERKSLLRKLGLRLWR
jgi:hypothetical protein